MTGITFLRAIASAQNKSRPKAETRLKRAREMVEGSTLDPHGAVAVYRRARPTLFYPQCSVQWTGMRVRATHQS
jgi:hypothetical protein